MVLPCIPSTNKAWESRRTVAAAWLCAFEDVADLRCLKVPGPAVR